jgi:hypothetical protein
VANPTVTCLPLAASNVAVKLRVAVPVSPSATEPPVIEIAGAGSSSTIVPTPCPSPIVALVGLLRSTENVSSSSSVSSPRTGTSTVFDVWPGLKVRSPLVLV